MKNLFIDCGTAEFQGITESDKIYKFNPIDWDIMMFEANPITYDFAKRAMPLWLSQQKFEFFNQAVAVGHGIVNINCADIESDSYQRLGKLLRVYSKLKFFIYKLISSKKFTSQGSNILIKAPLRDGDHRFRYKVYEVEKFDIATWMSAHRNEYENIIIKMDIEGAEFDVLERMLELNIFDSVQKIYVEFHERFFDDIKLYENKKLRLISAMKAHGTDVVDWF
jgi:FkbM family methyltransferase